jgi:pSer/pThr/pTyr-binding forkhead associated (FHA) protein
MKARLCDTRRCDREIFLERFPVVLGRGPNAGIRLQDDWVSRVHCEISERNGTLFMRDLGSTNGSEINGRKAAESPLMPGDELGLGVTTFLVYYETAEKCLMPTERRVPTGSRRALLETIKG